MISLILGLFSNPFFDLLGKPMFWLGLGIAVVMGFLIFICIKYPKGGLPVLGVVFALGLVAFDAYCIIQLNLYYNAEGGVHGVLTGIFDTNKVDIVDNLTFEIKNIELTESTEGVYSASITTDQVLSLDSKQSLGIFVNGMPCDTTSEVHSDFAYAEYPYTFYDNDKTAICTDTLILNIAFYENSTYLNLSTKGGTLPVEECVKYWHHYFNKNGFIVKVAPFDSTSKDLGYTSGNISNYSIVKYYVDNKLYKTDSAPIGTVYQLEDYDSNFFYGWRSEDGLLLGEQVVLIKNLNLHIEYVTDYDYVVTFIVDNDHILCPVSEGEFAVEPIEPIKFGYEFLGWTIDGENIVDVTKYPITEDVTFTAKFKYVASWKVLTNKDITVINSNLSFNPLNKTVEVSGLKANDIVRVTLSTFTILDEYDSGCPKAYYVGEGNGYNGGNFDLNDPYNDNIQSLILTSGESYMFENKITSGVGTLTVSCTEDGILTFTGSISNNLVYFADMIISKIEVYK